MSNESNGTDVVNGARPSVMRTAAGKVVNLVRPEAPSFPVILLPGDLIEDREVADFGSDRLAHADLANQLATLVTQVQTPANVALYGAWGSGKSGIANLLRERLRKNAKIKFARFDAFKYAENPLRRNFISAVATELGVEDRKFHADLYQGTTRADLTLPRDTIKAVLGLFAKVFGTMVAIIVFAYLAVSVFGDGVDLKALWASLPKNISLAMIPASVFAALVTLAGKTMTVERKTDRAESHEQFEAVFRDLIDKTDADRVVIFVDELDRCAPPDVVATLDAVRTFLGAPKCVFIVAADQQVLEEALTDSLQQARPLDAQNPYYSGGTAYLDKVFQYQISIPPLLTPNINRFATQLVESRTGVWSEVNVGRVIPVLVPSHVRSPRRVKSLLNAFAMTYRLAEQRQAGALLEGELVARADEIAKLVCLQVEFPLFARDLVAVPTLPEMVLQLLKDPRADLGARVTPEAKRLAARYATHEAAVTRLLLPDESDEDGSDDGLEGAEAEVRRSYGRQLTAYLTRTRSIAGPAADLIYMRSRGSVFGLPADLADELTALAEDADADSLRTRLAALEAEDKRRVISLLIQGARENAGLIAANYATSVLDLVADETLHAGDQSNEIVEALLPVLEEEDVLTSALAVPAWNLSVRADTDQGRALARLILEGPLPGDSLSAAHAVLATPHVALTADREATIALLAEYLVSDEADTTVAVLTAMSETDLASLLSEAAERAGQRLADAVAAHAQATKVAEEAAAAAAARPVARTTVATPAATPDEDAATPLDPADVIPALDRLLTHTVTSAPSATTDVIRILLAGGTTACNTAVEQHLGEVDPVTKPVVIGAMLRAVRTRAMGAWPTWLDAISVEGLRGPQKKALESLQRLLWDKASRADDEDYEFFEAAARAIARLVDAPSSVATQAVLESLTGHASEAAEAEKRSGLHVSARPLIDAGLVDGVSVALAEATALIATLNLADVDEPEDLEEYVDSTVPDVVKVLANHEGAQIRECEQAIASLVEPLYASPWLPQPRKVQLHLLAREHLASETDATALPALPTANDMAPLVRAGGPAFEGTLAAWIRLAKPGVDDLLTATRPRLRAASDPLLSAIETHRTSMPNQEQVRLLKAVLQTTSWEAPTQVAVAFGLQALPDGEVADLLIEQYQSVNANDERAKVLDLWRQADIRTAAVRKRLIETVLIPMLRLNEDEANNQAAREALRRTVALAGPTPPPGTKEALRTALQEGCAAPEDIQRKAVEVAESLGYRTGGKGLFSRGREIKDN